MDKVKNPYPLLMERLQSLERSIYILSLVNNDLREILHKKKPLPQFIQDSFKRSTLNRSKTTPALAAAAPTPTPIETEEMRLAASVIDKAKRTIENIGEKKSKSTSSLALSTVAPPAQTTKLPTNRPKNLPSSSRPSSASSTAATKSIPAAEVPPPQPAAPVRRFVPAHMKAPFLTQPEKKRRPSSSMRSNAAPTSSNQKVTAARRSLSQQRRQLSASLIPSVDESTQKAISALETPRPLTIEPDPLSSAQNDQQDPISNGVDSAHMNSELLQNESSEHLSNEPIDTEGALVPQSIILNRALVKPLRRVWKQNQALRLRLHHDLQKKSSPSPPFIDRLNQQIRSVVRTNPIEVPNIEVLLLLATKLRAVILHLLENSPFEDLESALRRLHTLKYLVDQYRHFFSPNVHIVVAKQHSRPKLSPRNIEQWLNQPKSIQSRDPPVRYTDDGQLMAFTEVRFRQFENECRWIELHWHEQMIRKFKQTVNAKDQNPLQLYRELMSLVTGLQTSAPIVVENRL